MNHLLIGSLLVISLNAEQCNQERKEGERSGENAEMSNSEELKDEEQLDSEQTQAMLEGQRWYILTMEEAALGLPEGAERPFIELMDGQLQGFGGCNNLMGGYTIEGSRLHFTEVGSTKKYCPELQATERSVLEMLSEVNGYLVEDEALYLLQGTRELAMLKTTDN